MPATADNPKLLVIGYGNELRRDDSLGPIFARKITQHALSGVEIVTAAQLTPELADNISKAGAVLFIDAVFGSAATLQLEPTFPVLLSNAHAHCSQPQLLLGLAQSLFGRCPPAWLLTLPGFDSGFGEGLSDSAAANLEPALAKFNELQRFVLGPRG